MLEFTWHTTLCCTKLATNVSTTKNNVVLGRLETKYCCIRGYFIELRHVAVAIVPQPQKLQVRVCEISTDKKNTKTYSQTSVNSLVRWQRVVSNRRSDEQDRIRRRKERLGKPGSKSHRRRRLRHATIIQQLARAVGAARFGRMESASIAHIATLVVELLNVPIGAPLHHRHFAQQRRLLQDAPRRTVKERSHNRRARYLLRYVVDKRRCRCRRRRHSLTRRLSGRKRERAIIFCKTKQNQKQEDKPVILLTAT